MSAVKSTVIEGKVYCRGVTEEGGDTEYIVYCYATSQDKWTTLPPLPVKWFGLGHVDSKLVAIGGWKRNGDQTNVVYTYDEQSRKWKQTIPPMPTSRVYPSVLSLKSHIFVIGGYSPSYTAAVEIFKSDVSQWFTADPLPKACCDMSSVAIDDVIYSLGGYKHPWHLSQAVCAPISDLLHTAVSAGDSVQSDISFTKSVWKKLPDTPTYEPAAAVLGGKLLAVGGTDKAKKGENRKEIYTFAEAAESWTYIGDLPAPRFDAAVAVVSSTEILVIGGWGGDTGQERVNTVYKGMLKLADH
jgi:hypothetical protein